MQDNQAELHSMNGRRLILVVDDEEINRALLGTVLETDYEVIFAEDGEKALRAVENNKELLSLVILDLIMPVMPGTEVLRRIKEEPAYQDIPVIVASGDQSQEIECLNIGASDFIQKPYPDPGVILARVRRAIELFVHSTRTSLPRTQNTCRAVRASNSQGVPMGLESREIRAVSSSLSFSTG